ncbi:MAG: hypothetical protein QOC81_3556 [Thermoanaerobaculia bacterium]|jgi:hypothetical protein|nr:hypothetical protein [Thermoanaerobaculia bacterium]
MDFDLDGAPLVSDFFLDLYEEGEGGLHIAMMSRSSGRLAGFPAWDHADRDLRHFTPDDIPLGTEEEPFEDADENWRIVIVARGHYVFVLEGDAPSGPLTRSYRIPRDRYLTAWNELMVRFHPPLALEDVLGEGDDLPDA